MDITNPYEKGFFPRDILRGLKYYFELLDKVDDQTYLKENFPFKRKDIQLTITFLESIPEEDKINRHYRSHPLNTRAMESIESISVLPFAELSKHKINIIWFLCSLLDSGIQILVHKAKADISQEIKDLPLNEKIKHLIEKKYYYTQNEGSFPEKFIEYAIEFCNSEIKKNKEIQQSEETNQVGNEVKQMVESYLSLISNNIQNNDLILPLTEKKYNKFVSKLTAMLYIPSYFDINEDDKERAFHIYLLGILQGRVIGYRVSSNKESGIGRYDILLHPIENRNPGVIIEIKKIENISNVEVELNKALKQIDNKNYNTELKSCGVTTTLNIAIVFEGLKPHTKYKVN